MILPHLNYPRYSGICLLHILGLGPDFKQNKQMFLLIPKKLTAMFPTPQLNFISANCARGKSSIARKPEIHSKILIVKHFSKM